ncbi:hypothetical protein BV96_04709 [Sphingomonas paucimobilis]|nr:hypothetical protein BV96_04709 [Sphingomonas paucimobilis]
MATMTVWLGNSGTEEVWYLKRGGSGFLPIDINLLPGPKPAFPAPANQVTNKDTDTVWTNEVNFGGRVLMNTAAGTTTMDVLTAWNTVKNMQATSLGGQNVYVDGIVHVDIQFGYNTIEASNIFLNGVKRANVITGDAGDTIDIRMCYDQNSVWVDDFRISTFGGNDFVRVAPLDVAAELAAGDLTFTESVNKPGLPLLTSGVGHKGYYSLGSGDDRFIGYTMDDHVDAGTDSGQVEIVYSAGAPSGFAYSIGGATSGGHNSILYKINLSTGQATAVGPVAITGVPGNSGTNLDVESLAFNPVDGLLYGFVKNTGSNIGLIKVDPTTASTTFIGGNISAYKSELQDFAFTGSGKLFFVSDGDLLTVNTATGNYTLVGNDTLSKKIAALAINPTNGNLYGLAQEGSKTVVSLIKQSDGTVVSLFEVTNLPSNAKIEGMSFDSSGKLWAEDRISGTIYTIDLVTHLSTAVSTTLGTSGQTGDGFEQLAIDGRSMKVITDIHANGGDLITTGGGFDHLFYAAGDGVDRVTDFDKTTDVLHISGYKPDEVSIQEWSGNTIIRFLDSSLDGFVDHSMIQLDGVTEFDPAMINYMSAADYYNL